MDRWPMGEIACMTIKKEVTLHNSSKKKSFIEGITDMTIDDDDSNAQKVQAAYNLIMVVWSSSWG